MLAGRGSLSGVAHDEKSSWAFLFRLCPCSVNLLPSPKPTEIAGRDVISLGIADSSRKGCFQRTIRMARATCNRPAKHPIRRRSRMDTLNLASLVAEDRSTCSTRSTIPWTTPHPTSGSRGRAPSSPTPTAGSTSTGSSCLWNVNVGHGRRELAEAAADADGHPGLLDQLCRLHQRPGHPAGRAPDGDRLSEPRRHLLRQRRRRGERERLQDRPLLLEGEGPAGQGEDHLPPVRLPRGDAGGHERHRRARLRQDVRAPGAELHPHRHAVSLPARGRAGPARPWARPPPACWRRRSCRRAPTRWRPSSPSRCRGRAA